MKLILVYGPPASGKLTTARALENVTGFALCHNHLTVDAVRPLFPHGDESEDRSDLLKRMRVDILTTAARLGRDTIFTLAYSGRVDNDFVADIVAGVEEEGGMVNFVQLHAPPEVLLDRVTSPHRAAMGKIHDPGRLAAQLGRRDQYATMPYDTLRIDTTIMKPAESAELIVDTFGLARAHQPLAPPPPGTPT